MNITMWEICVLNVGCVTLSIQRECSNFNSAWECMGENYVNIKYPQASCLLTFKSKITTTPVLIVIDYFCVITFKPFDTTFLFILPLRQLKLNNSQSAWIL